MFKLFLVLHASCCYRKAMKQEMRWLCLAIISIFVISLAYHFGRHQLILLDPKSSNSKGEKNIWQTTTVVQTTPVAEADVIFQALSVSDPYFDHSNFTSSTSGKKSRYYLAHSSNKYTTGNILSIVVETFDHSGRRKSSGGDFFIARLFNNSLISGTSGTVHDFNNGTYLITFPLYWEGEAWISIKLYHSAEAVSVLRMLRENYTHRSAFRGIFVSNNMRETTKCGSDLSANEPLCDFSDQNSGVKWFCGKPKTLSCEHFKYAQCYSPQQYSLNQEERWLLDRSNILTEVAPKGPASIHVQKKDQATTLAPCVTRPFEPKNPTGFVFNGTWTSVECQMQYFHSEDKAVPCLKGKKIYFIGDSTSRQWWEYLVKLIPSFKVFHEGKRERTEQHLAVDFSNNIYLQWTTHGPPWETGEEYVFLNLQPTVNQINSLFGGPEFVIILNLGAHFTPFPLKLYIERLIHIRTALKRLLARNPETTVILKTTNTREVSSDLLFRSDWLTFQLNTAVSEIFKGMKIGLLDAWDITVAYGSWTCHPPLHVIKNEVDLLMSYICPNK